MFRIILMAVVSFFVFRFLQRMTTPRSMHGEGWFSRKPRSRERKEQYPDAIDADFEELDEKK
jgi:hypothetical protein